MKELRFPTIFNKVDLPENEDEISEKLEQCIGHIVLVKDMHNSTKELQYSLGTITKVNAPTYQFRRFGTQDIKCFHIHDLQELIEGSTYTKIAKIKAEN